MIPARGDQRRHTKHHYARCNDIYVNTPAPAPAPAPAPVTMTRGGGSHLTFPWRGQWRRLVTGDKAADGPRCDGMLTQKHGDNHDRRRNPLRVKCEHNNLESGAPAPTRAAWSGCCSLPPLCWSPVWWLVTMIHVTHDRNVAFLCCRVTLCDS